MSYKNAATAEELEAVIGGDVPVAEAEHAGSADSAAQAAKVGDANVGSSTRPVYLDAGVPKQCGNTLNVSVSGSAGSATSATKATQDGDGNVISETYAKKSEVGGGGAQQLTNEDLNEMIGAEYWGKDYYADEGNGVMYAPTLNGEAFYLQIRHGGDDFTVQFIAVIDIQRVAVRCWHRFISPTIGCPWIEIATEGSEGGASTRINNGR